MTNHSRIAAAALAAITILVVLSSSVFIIEHADHDCTGEDCPICEQLYACAQNLKNLAAAVAVVMAMIAFGFAVVTSVADEPSSKIANNGATGVISMCGE